MNCWIILLLLLCSNNSCGCGNNYGTRAASDGNCGCGDNGSTCNQEDRRAAQAVWEAREATREAREAIHDAREAIRDAREANCDSFTPGSIPPPPRADFGYNYDNEGCGCQN